VTEKGYATARLDEIERVGGWIPIRRHLDIGAFGVNAWTGDEGAEIIGAHEETSSGHEELYVVIEGHASFVVAGETIDAPAGTIVFVRDPAANRGATATAPGTTILTAGAKPGEAYQPLGWEENAGVIALFGQERYAEAKAKLVDAIERWPESAALLYNLACAESRLGETDAALVHLARAVVLEPSLAESAQTDPDLEAIRDDPRFPDLDVVAQSHKPSE
jgi:tetratricopeptide (TPR) repeat protein